MSVGNSAGINFSGLSSGIDTNSIVDRLMQLQRVQVTRVQQRAAQVQQKRDLYTQLKAAVSNFRSASGALNNAGAFASVSTTSSVTDVATVSGTDGAGAGNYALKVYQLAQAQKLGSSAQTDATSALGFSGDFKVNGTTVSVTATDTLSGIAEKINNAGAGVTASIINGGTGRAYLNLTSNTQGQLSPINLENVSGNVLSGLGLDGTSLRTTVSNGFQSFGADSATTTLNKIFGFTATGPTTVTIGGQSISIDPTTDTLTTLAAKINGNGDLAASVVSSTEMGRTVYRLQVQGTTTPTVTDSSNVLEDLGILKRNSEIVGAKDAIYSLDGIALRNSSNDVTTAIPNVALKLLQADATTGKDTTIAVSRDTSAIKTKIKNFVDAYNAIGAFVADNSKFDKDSYASGPLFGDFLSQQVRDTLSAAVFQDIPGLSAGSNNATIAGLGLDQGTTLKFDESAFDTKFKSDPAMIAKLFQSSGTASGTGLTYVSSLSETIASGAGAYDVNITTVATKQVVTAKDALVGLTSGSENLTFSGGPFSATGVTLNIPPGKSLSEIVSLINNDSKTKDYVVASEVGGKLTLTASRYGTPGNFTVVSSVASGASSSGIGTAGEAAITAGVDVAGTINGEPATGSGQYLTGNSSAATNPKTNGLQVQYTGSVTGAIGSVRLVKGLAGSMNETVDKMLRATDGLFAATDTTMQSQIDDFNASIDRINLQLTAKEQALRDKFTRMESAISAAQAQSQRLAAMLGTSK